MLSILFILAVQGHGKVPTHFMFAVGKGGNGVDEEDDPDTVYTFFNPRQAEAVFMSLQGKISLEAVGELVKKFEPFTKFTGHSNQAMIVSTGYSAMVLHYYAQMLARLIDDPTHPALAALRDTNRDKMH